MRVAAPEAPLFWIIAGPNGSGKSTFYQKAIAKKSGLSVWIINPDKLADQIRKREKRPDWNLEAVKRIELWLKASIRAYQSIAVETVLSTGKYRRMVKSAHQHGFRFRLTYVLLDSPERSISRVQIRVKSGGHSVPRDKVVSRYHRSIKQLSWFLSNADDATIYDNSGKSPRLIAEKQNGKLVVDKGALEPIQALARKINR